MLENFRTEELVWDKASSYIYESYRASTSDERGRRLLVRIVNGGQEEALRDYDLSLSWEHENNGNSGLDAFEQVGEEDGVYELYYTTGMLSNFGNLEANLYLTNGQESITSEPFIIEVFKGVNMDSVESSDSFSTLTGYIARLRGLEGNFNQWEDAENARVEAEDVRVASEDERVRKEDERSDEYLARRLNESLRVNQEYIREQAEADRRANEVGRVTAEEGRVVSEEGRVVSEQGRESAEQERVGNENARNNTEADVIASEALRKEAELGRVNAEDGRVTSENLREQEYSTRLANEDERVLSEQGREVAEADREANEDSRVTAEQGREVAEADRVSNEGSRVTAEDGREVAEADRVSNEGSRVTAEQGREGRLAGLEYEVREVIQEKIDEKFDEEIAKIPEGLNPYDFVDLDGELQDVDSFVEMAFDELYEIVAEENQGSYGVTVKLRSRKQDLTEGEDVLLYRGGRLVDYLGYSKGMRLDSRGIDSLADMFKNTIVNDLPKFDDRSSFYTISDSLEGMFEGATLTKSVSIGDLGIRMSPMYIGGMFRGLSIPSEGTTLDLRDISMGNTYDASEMFKDAVVKGEVIFPRLGLLMYGSSEGMFDGAEIRLASHDASVVAWLIDKAEGNTGVTVRHITT